MAPVVRLGTGGEPAARPSPASTLPAAVRLDLAELLLLAERCGSPRLPLDLDASADADGDPSTARLQERLAGGTRSTGDQARDLVAAAHQRVADDSTAVASGLVALGLLDDAGTPHRDVVTALGVLAAPEVMLVLDLVVRREPGADRADADRADADREDRLRSWFAVRGDVVAQLATATGLDHELAWYGVGGLTAALTRAATVDDEEPAPPVPMLDVPFEVFTDGTEAVRRDRDDLLAEVVRRTPAPTLVDGVPASATATAELVAGLETSTTGRLRLVVSGAGNPEERAVLGVVTWLRTGGGWRELSARTVDGVPTVRISPVGPGDLARSVGPVLAQVVR
jgi:hypothetical protein